MKFFQNIFKKKGLKLTKEQIDEIDKKIQDTRKKYAEQEKLGPSLSVFVDKELEKKIGQKKAGELAKKPEFLKLKIPGFDSLFHHGIPIKKTILVEGSPGTGKTIFCLQTAYNMAKDGKRVLYMSFEESADSLKQHMRQFDWDPEEMIQKGLLRIERFSALDIARSVEALLSAAKRELLIATEPILFPRDFEPEVIMIDSLTSIASAFSGEEYRFRIYIEQLFRHLEKQKITSFLIREAPIPTHIGVTYVEHEEAISFLSDGIICIYSVVYADGNRGNAIEILKMRGESFRKVIVELKITNKGLAIYPDAQPRGNYKLT